MVVGQFGCNKEVGAVVHEDDLGSTPVLVETLSIATQRGDTVEWAHAASDRGALLAPRR